MMSATTDPQYPDWQASRQISAWNAPPRSIELLLLEDSRFDADAVSRLCEQTDLPVSLTVADDFPSYRTAIEAQRFDMVMLDYLLPEGDGLMARDLLRTVPCNALVPTVMISNETRHDVAVAAMKAGCMDYMAKDGLAPEVLRDLLLRAISPRAEAGLPAELLPAIREMLREELARNVGGFDLAQIQAAWAALGTLNAPAREPDWMALFEEEEAHFVFRTPIN